MSDKYESKDQLNEAKQVCEAPTALTPSLEEQLCFAADQNGLLKGARSGITGELELPFTLVNDDAKAQARAIFDALRGESNDDAEERARAIFDAKGLLSDDEDAVYSAYKNISAEGIANLERVFKENYNTTVQEYLKTFMNDDEMQKVNNIRQFAPMEYNDRHVRLEARTLNTLASDQVERKVCDPESSADLDSALQRLAQHLLESRKSRTLSDNHGWTKAWTNALRALPVEDTVEMAVNLATAYNAQAGKAGSSERVSVEVGNAENGKTLLQINRKDPNGYSGYDLQFELPALWPDVDDEKSEQH